MAERRIHVEVNDYNKNGILAIATVTLDNLLRFSVMMRNNSEGKAFLSYPRRSSKGGEWEDVVLPDPALKEEILKKIGEAYREKYLMTAYNAIDLQDIQISYINQDQPVKERSVVVRGMATITINDLKIRGVAIKESAKGMFVNMPQYKAAEGSYRDSVYACRPDLREQLADMILAHYRENVPKFGTKELAKEQTEWNRVKAAVESTEDYTEPGFHQELVNPEIHYNQLIAEAASAEEKNKTAKPVEQEMTPKR